MVDIESVKQLFELYQTEYNKSIHSMKLTDEVCLQLLDCYFSPECKVIASSLLHVCVHSPPCSEDEKEITTNGKKWCKGRKIQYGSFEFDKSAMLMRELYEQSEKRRIKLKPELKKKISQEVEQLTDLDLELRLEKLGTSEKKELIGKEIDEDFDKRISKLYFNDNKENVLKEVKKISEKLQDKKVKNKVESDVITITKKSMNKVKNEIKENETKDVSNVLNKMTDVLSGLNERLQTIEKQTLSIDTKQDKVLELAETINAKQELQQYVNTWYKSKYGIAKKIVLAPLKALNIIVWKPAKNAFWTFFGKYFYLIWGVLMMMLILSCCLTAYSYFRTYAPTFFNLINEGIIYVLGASARSGNVLSQLLFPIFKESLNVFYSSASTFVISIKDFTINYLYELIMKVIELVTSVLTKSVADKLTWW
jgi:hypothetical protein